MMGAAALRVVRSIAQKAQRFPRRSRSRPAAGVGVGGKSAWKLIASTE